jgi:hypothetical protein
MFSIIQSANVLLSPLCFSEHILFPQKIIWFINVFLHYCFWISGINYFQFLGEFSLQIYTNQTIIPHLSPRMYL